MIPKDWSIANLGEVAEVLDPQPDHRTPPEVLNGVPYIGVNDFLPNGEIDIKSCRKVSEEVWLKQQANILVDEGGIIFGKIGTIGMPRMLPTTSIKYALSANVVLIKPKVNRSYILAWLRSEDIQNQIYRTLHTTSQPALGIKKIRELLVNIPPLLEQCKIAEVLGVWDESIDLLEKLIGKTRSRKQGLMQQLLTGKKRFKEFEGSEWKEVEFGQVVLDTKLGTVKRGMGKGSNIPLVKMGNMSWGNLNLDKLEYVDEEILESKDFILKSGDFLFNTRNTPELVGKSAVWNNQLPKAVFDNNINRIRFHDSVNSSFICFQLTYGSGKKKIHAASSGTTSVSAIYWKSLQKISLFLPSLPEQKKIAAVLSAADDEISTLEKQLAVYKQQKLGLMQQLLTGRIRI